MKELGMRLEGYLYKGKLFLQFLAITLEKKYEAQ
jgi:hypothetical protein